MSRTVVILSITLLLTSMAYADQYEVLIVDIAEPSQRAKVEGFKRDAAQLNALHRKGYSAAKPYFNVLQMADKQVYFVFGFKDEVQGIISKNYSKTVKNLRRIRKNGAIKYPNPHWVPVEKIRRLLTRPGS